jgi:hypothetical protein
MNDLKILAKEVSVESSSSTEINQIQNLFVSVIHVVRWVWISLHAFPLE